MMTAKAGIASHFFWILNTSCHYAQEWPIMCINIDNLTHQRNTYENKHSN